tara:strand:- start:37474 stop:37788 length:315 start_codon:yes stop_codon:yes gene_type:complete
VASPPPAPLPIEVENEAPDVLSMEADHFGISLMVVNTLPDLDLQISAAILEPCILLPKTYANLITKRSYASIIQYRSQIANKGPPVLLNNRPRLTRNYPSSSKV